MNDNLLDDDLKAVMDAGRCGDCAAPEKEKKISADAKWEPAPSQSPPLVSCVKSVFPIAVASSIVFWWMQTEALATDTGFYTLIVLALMFGLKIGKYAIR